MTSGDDSAGDRIVVIVDHGARTVDTPALRDLLERVITGEGADVASVTVVLSDHATVHRMNREYLDHDFETDVLAFDLRDEGSSAIDGEIYVDLDTAAERCAEFGTSFEREASLYALHGLLHLMGFRDKEEADREEMRRLEEHYLSDVEL